MTEPNRPPPWPCTWPPFWRNVLHVAIAVGVGNLVLLGSFFALGWLHIGWEGLPFSVAATVVAAVLGLVTRANRRAARALLLVFLAGSLVNVSPFWITQWVFGAEALQAFQERLHQVFGPLFGSPLWMGIVELPVAILQFVVMGVLFMLLSMAALSRRLVLVLLLGVVLRFTGWLSVGACRTPHVLLGFASLPMQAWSLLSPMTFLTFITLGYALVGKVMLSELERFAAASAVEPAAPDSPAKP